LTTRQEQPRRQQLERLWAGTASCPVTKPAGLGPFYREGAPFTNDLYPEDATGPVLYFRGTVSDTDCNRLSGVTVHVWHADDVGGYDNDDPDNLPPPDFFRCRARMTSDEEGVFEFRALRPGNYQPDPIGRPYWTRARHLHFMLILLGFEPYITEICFEPDDFLATDFWATRELVTHLEEVRDGDGSVPYFRAGFDFVLKPVSKRGYLDEAFGLGMLPG
jgi:catechol 1,2-dioxygenase